MKTFVVQGDLFGGLNDGLLSRAEALAAVDIGKHQSGQQPGPPLGQLKHDMVYHHGVGGPPPHNARPHQVLLFLARKVVTNYIPSILYRNPTSADIM